MRLLATVLTVAKGCIFCCVVLNNNNNTFITPILYIYGTDLIKLQTMLQLSLEADDSVHNRNVYHQCWSLIIRLAVAIFHQGD
jgi:hypothetical protein